LKPVTLAHPAGRVVDLADAQRVIAECLDGFYNTARMHSTIGYCSPSSTKSCQLSAAEQHSFHCPLFGGKPKIPSP